MAPWSGFWDRNFFAARIPALEQLLGNPFVRGAVSGLGAITTVAGFAELAGVLGSRRRAAAPGTAAPPGSPTPTVKP